LNIFLWLTNSDNTFNFLQNVRGNTVKKQIKNFFIILLQNWNLIVELIPVVLKVFVRISAGFTILDLYFPLFNKYIFCLPIDAYRFYVCSNYIVAIENKLIWIVSRRYLFYLFTYIKIYFQIRNKQFKTKLLCYKN